MNFIKVTVVDSVLSESGEQKMVALSSDYSEDKLDCHGYTKEKYEDLNISIPKDSIHYNPEKEDLNKEIELGDADIEIIRSEAYFLKEDFKLVVAREDFGSRIYLKSKYTLDVAESPRQIINKLNK